ncbi:SDR family oxidoreductase [Spirosoma sp. KNUC1025]|uniref:SDR family oxidoreductase n=1 Tax=Spirosoma sp. KNUC1025 TaxID=2894082 RepID=UPI001E6448AB|nr:SDR family NAD(P)-dependent oxidoreductase [Spirosoma sp. KNUC1025]UFH57753.1 SDR family NAD(P)-dependent oxidoreductase [Spirosoma sp. KNUC1025]
MKTTENTILITGGSSGIGLAMARRFAQLGNEVIITGRDADKLRQAQTELPGLHTVQGDLSRPKDLDALIHYLEQHHPGLNVLINNASVQYNYTFDVESEALGKIEYEISANLMAPIKLIWLLLPLLKANADPAIINVSSSLGFVPKASAPVYDATKAGIHVFTKALRYQLPDVQVMEVIPPLVDTPMTAGRGQGKLSPDTLVDKFMKGWQANQPEMRIGRAKALLALHRWLPNVAERMIQRH